MTFAPLPQMPNRRRRVVEVERPNRGLYLDRDPRQIPDRGLRDCQNVRIRDGRITNEGVWYEFFFAHSLGDQVLLIDDFIQTNGASITIFGTKKDLFRYDSASDKPLYINPFYATGTVDVTNGSATVTRSTGTTAWTSNLKDGDYIHIGSNSQNDPTEDWYEIDTVVSDTELTLASNYTGVTDTAVAYTARTTFTAEDTDFWDTEVFPEAAAGAESSYVAGDRWFGTNGQEIVAWDGSSDSVVIIATSSAGLAFRCKFLTYYKNMMLYGNLIESGTSKPANVKNSALGDPENVTTLEASEFVMAEGVDFLEYLLPLGDFVVGYASNSVNVAQFIGTPFFFAVRTAIPGVGLYSSRTVVDFGAFHEFLGTDRAYRFDGIQLRPHADHVFTEVLRIADRERASKSLAFISEEELEVYWVVALTSDSGVSSSLKSAETSFTEHYAENVGNEPTPFTKRALPATAAGFFVQATVGRWSDFPSDGFDDVDFRFNDRFFSAEFPIVLFGDEDGRIFKLNTRNAPTSYASFPVRPMTDGRSKGILRRIEPYLEKVEPGANMSISPEVGDRASGALVEEDTGFIRTDHGDERFYATRAPGRYWSWRLFNALFQVTTWSLTGYRAVIDEIGER